MDFNLRKNIPTELLTGCIVRLWTSYFLLEFFWLHAAEISCLAW